MKRLNKYLAIIAVLAVVPVAANADVSVKDTTSYEFIHNQGYSDEVHRIIEVKTKDPATPIAKETDSKMKKFGWYLLETIDPSVNRPGKFVDHSTNFSPSIDDL